MATIGEKEFERFCTQHGFTLHKVKEQENKTPDYELLIGGIKIIVEIKDLEANEEEKEADNHRRTHNWAVWGSNSPGTRIRYKIEEAKEQLRTSVKGNELTLLILYDARPLVIKGISPYEMKVAMYGIETFHLAVPKDYRPPMLTGHKFGKNSKLRPNKNDHISAIGILENGQLSLYHNIFAANPLPKELFTNLPMAEQYTLETEGTTDDFCDWKKIGS